MGCSQGKIDPNCTKEQSFCSINGQTVAKNTDINVSLGTIPESITDTIWLKVKTALTNINKYGKRGTHNPSTNSINKITGIANNEIIYQTMYNNIIAALHTGPDNNDTRGTTISGNPVITKAMLENLQTWLTKYQLNPNRCDSCNTKCNTACEDSTQSGGGDGGGDGCGDCQASCMSAQGTGDSAQSDSQCTEYYDPWTSTYLDCRAQI